MEIFGPCSNENGHGHNFELFVTIKGKVNPDNGFVINLKALSPIIKDKVIDKLDHKNINLDVDFMKNKIPSTENLVLGIWNQLQRPIAEHGASLHCIKVYETENNFVEYFGE
jgi:6-pyruvoyltetrahydropterin/6-carboxytetrahydropterin synthase